MSFFAAFSPTKPTPVEHEIPPPDTAHHSNYTHDEHPEVSEKEAPPFNPMDSIIIQKEKWTPYKNALIFASSVLLWERPVILIILSIFTHLVLWFGTRLIAKAHYSILLGLFLWCLFVSDYIMKLSGNSWSRLLQRFPGPANTSEPNHNYDEIIHQYVTARRQVYALIRKGKQLRQENFHQFTISALFFSLILCTFLYCTKTFLLFYVFVFSCLLGPGLVKHDVPIRLWEFLQPHLLRAYQTINGSLQDVINPPPNPNGNNPNPAPVQRPNSGTLPPRGAQYGSEGLHSRPQRPSQMPYSSSHSSAQSPLYRNTSSTSMRPSTNLYNYPPQGPEVHSMPASARSDGSNRATYSSESHISQRNSAPAHPHQW